MHISFSIPDHLAYGADEPRPDRPVAQDIADAAYQTVHGSPGGVAALAVRMGVSANTLTHKANPNNDSHFLRPHELVQIQELTGDHRVLRAMAHRLGMEVQAALPDVAGGDPLQTQQLFLAKLGELLRALNEPQFVPGGLTRNHLRHTEETAADLVTLVGNMVAAQRGQLRRAPVVEG